MSSFDMKICFCCFMNIKSNESSVHLECKHDYHYKCFITMMECDDSLTYNKCPCCSEKLDVPFYSFEKDTKIKKKRSKCPICLEKLGYEFNVHETECKHNFHKSCIGTWLSNNDTCPMCRTVLGERDTGRPRPVRIRPSPLPDLEIGQSRDHTYVPRRSLPPTRISANERVPRIFNFNNSSPTHIQHNNSSSPQPSRPPLRRLPSNPRLRLLEEEEVSNLPDFTEDIVETFPLEPIPLDLDSLSQRVDIPENLELETHSISIQSDPVSLNISTSISRNDSSSMAAILGSGDVLRNSLIDDLTINGIPLIPQLRRQYNHERPEDRHDHED